MYICQKSKITCTQRGSSKRTPTPLPQRKAEVLFLEGWVPTYI